MLTSAKKSARGQFFVKNLKFATIRRHLPCFRSNKPFWAFWGLFFNLTTQNNGITPSSFKMWPQKSIKIVLKRLRNAFNASIGYESICNWERTWKVQQLWSITLNPDDIGVTSIYQKYLTNCWQGFWPSKVKPFWFSVSLDTRPQGLWAANCQKTN